ncbi:hypothetical protein Q5752_001905 [Cryptotrichosporon argae]
MATNPALSFLRQRLSSVGPLPAAPRLTPRPALFSRPFAHSPAPRRAPAPTAAGPHAHSSTSLNGARAHAPTPPGAGAGAGAGAGSKTPQRPSAMKVWYREIVPAMLPIFLLSTTIFLSLSLLRTHLSHARSLSESAERIAALEAELARARDARHRQRERERRERERILPLVVERVLQRVGAMSSVEDEDEPLLV